MESLVYPSDDKNRYTKRAKTIQSILIFLGYIFIFLAGTSELRGILFTFFEIEITSRQALLAVSFLQINIWVFWGSYSIYKDKSFIFVGYMFFTLLLVFLSAESSIGVIIFGEFTAVVRILGTAFIVVSIIGAGGYVSLIYFSNSQSKYASSRLNDESHLSRPSPFPEEDLRAPQRNSERLKMTQEKSDYYDLQKELYRLYNRRRNFGIALLIGTIFGILTIFWGIRDHLAIVTLSIATLFVIFMVFFSLTMLHLFWINMNQSDYEEKMVKRGVEYLSKRRLSKERIEIIGKRAEIGSNALSSRAILPLTTIPLLITYFSGKISPETQLFIAIALISIGVSFILELDKANMDVLIRQIYVSYIPSRREKENNKK